ncbi:hypothetical protein XELAEV_18002408mg [Xenopus laevis]|nr:hypothetical protein XELAEV_18002408mg [Xenopus laevis]
MYDVPVDLIITLLKMTRFLITYSSQSYVTFHHCSRPVKVWCGLLDLTNIYILLTIAILIDNKTFLICLFAEHFGYANRLY